MFTRADFEALPLDLLEQWQAGPAYHGLSSCAYLQDAFSTRDSEQQVRIVRAPQIGTMTATPVPGRYSGWSLPTADRECWRWWKS